MPSPNNNGFNTLLSSVWKLLPKFKHAASQWTLFYWPIKKGLAELTVSKRPTTSSIFIRIVNTDVTATPSLNYTFEFSGEHCKTEAVTLFGALTKHTSARRPDIGVINSFTSQRSVQNIMNHISSDDQLRKIFYSLFFFFWSYFKFITLYWFVECLFLYTCRPVSISLSLFLRFNDLKATISLKNGVVWDVTKCGSCKNRRFGGT
jgi:hypothetical protein